jgi:carboxylesterase type B
MRAITPELTLVLQGHSAGSSSVSMAITRREPDVAPPFRAGIMLSSEKVSASPVLNFSIFDAFATAMGCGQSPGPERLQCLRNVPASTIRAYTNGPNSGAFTAGVDKYAFCPTQEEVLMSSVA